MPNPTTWFNQERFNDPPDTWARKEQSENKVPVGMQIQLLEEKIKTHPANGESTSHNPHKTPEQMEELKQLRVKLRDLKEKAVQ
jgi:hypothetical protein